jgi:ethanolamine utilization microcompartment shell protein EutS
MSEALGTGAYRNIEIQNGGSTRMTITSAGNIGIGTITPNERLTVVGNISAAGDIAVATRCNFSCT